MKISLDTNILIDSPEIIFDDTKQFCISFTVIRELDKLKRNPLLKRSAQLAISNIWKLYQEDGIEILSVPNLLGESPDEQIIQDTKDSDDTSILSNDIAVRIIAKAHGVPVSSYEGEESIDYDYTGITTVPGTVDYEMNQVSITDMQIDEFNELFQVDLAENQFCIIERLASKNDIWVRKGALVIRISQSMKPFRDAGIIISPLDSEQMCAIYAVFDDTVPLTIIDGALGTGRLA